MSKVTNNLYIGNIYQATNLGWLKERGITHIINCTQEVNNTFPYYFVYHKLNLMDTLQQPLYSSLESTHKIIENIISDGGIVLVHCYAGMSRSSSIVIYHLMRSRGWDYQTAYTYLKQRHPPTNPNPGFVRQLSMIK